jgi:hypothetical protein
VVNPGRQIGAKPTFATVDLETMRAEWFSIAAEGQQQLSAEPAVAGA